MRLVSPGLVVLVRHRVRQLHAARRIVGLDAPVEFLEQAAEQMAILLIGIAEAQTAGVHPADMRGRLHQHHGRAFTRRAHGRTHARRRGSIDEDIGSHFLAAKSGR